MATIAASRIQRELREVNADTEVGMPFELLIKMGMGVLNEWGRQTVEIEWLNTHDTLICDDAIVFSRYKMTVNDLHFLTYLVMMSSFSHARDWDWENKKALPA